MAGAIRCMRSLRTVVLILIAFVQVPQFLWIELLQMEFEAEIFDLEKEYEDEMTRKGCPSSKIQRYPNATAANGTGSISMAPQLATREPRLYLCGWVYPESVPSLSLLFPNHTYVPLTPNSCPPDPHTALPTDVLVSSERHDPACRGVWPDKDYFFYWIRFFKGKILVRNGEAREIWKGPWTKNVYHIGFYEDSIAERKIRIRALQMTLLEYGPEWWSKLLDRAHRPVSKRERFLVYAATNCVDHRERAVDRLAEINVVDRGGPCYGVEKNETRFQMPPAEEFSTTDWASNRDRFSIYRFCLVMENEDEEGYVTEKILNAFLAGCVPIWYGSKEIFDIFNKEAFIYYDIYNPEPSIARVRELETNKTAYDKIMMQPILANGEETIEKYFSYNDDLGGGKLIKKLHRMMGIVD